jgi:hypothetical protein
MVEGVLVEIGIVGRVTVVTGGGAKVVVFKVGWF